MARIILVSLRRLLGVFPFLPGLRLRRLWLLVLRLLLLLLLRRLLLVARLRRLLDAVRL